MLELRNVETFYGNIRALNGISLTVGKGEIVALIGSNGAGKSTALMTISGIVPLHSGSIIFENQAIDKKTPDEIVSLGISQAPEGRRIFSQLSVLENLNMGAFLRTDDTDIKNDMNYIFRTFPGSLSTKTSARWNAERRRTADAGNLPGNDGETQAAFTR